MQNIKITTYRDKRGEYRWRMERSGRIVADSGEGYSRRDSALKAVQHVTGAIGSGHYHYVCA